MNLRRTQFSPSAQGIYNRERERERHSESESVSDRQSGGGCGGGGPTIFRSSRHDPPQILVSLSLTEAFCLLSIPVLSLSFPLFSS